MDEFYRIFVFILNCNFHHLQLFCAMSFNKFNNVLLSCKLQNFMKIFTSICVKNREELSIFFQGGINWNFCTKHFFLVIRQVSKVSIIRLRKWRFRCMLYIRSKDLNYLEKVSYLTIFDLNIRFQQYVWTKGLFYLDRKG